MKKVWTVFRLNNAISGISNSGIEYDDTDFTILRHYEGVFKTEAECEPYIKETLEDYRSRKVGEGVRFIVLPVYCYDNDEKFKTV